MNIQKLKNIVNEIDGGVVKPVYLFQGDDQFLHQLVVNKIETTMSRERDCEKIILEPDEWTLDLLLVFPHSSSCSFSPAHPDKMAQNSISHLLHTREQKW